MESIRAYIFSVICMAVLCGLAQWLLSGSNVQISVKLITGLMLTVTVIGPLLQERSISVADYFDEIVLQGDLMAQAGEEAAMIAREEIIMQNVQTYILDKATQLGAKITVDVKLSVDNPPVPESVTVKGCVSAYVKQQLSDCLEKDLGIAEDKQVWTS